MAVAIHRPSELEWRMLYCIRRYNSSPAVFLRITSVMRKKNNPDAPTELRHQLAKHCIHDYETQPKGRREDGAVVSVAVIDGTGISRRRMTLYRTAGRGDCRYSISDLKTMVLDNEAIALTFCCGEAVAIRLTDKVNWADFESGLELFFGTPRVHPAFNHILKTLRGKVGQWIPSPFTGKGDPPSNDVGYAVEKEFGVKPNPKKKPDLTTPWGRVELKSKASDTDDTLFNKAPDVDISPAHAGPGSLTVRIVRTFGYPDPKGRPRVQLNIDVGTSPTAASRYLFHELEKDRLVQKQKLPGRAVTIIAAWHLSVLQHAFEEKHPMTCWIQSRRQKRGAKWYYQILSCEFTVAADFERFLSLIESDELVFNWASWAGHTSSGKSRCAFRLRTGSRRNLFGEVQREHIQT